MTKINNIIFSLVLVPTRSEPGFFITQKPNKNEVSHAR